MDRNQAMEATGMMELVCSGHKLLFACNFSLVYLKKIGKLQQYLVCILLNIQHYLTIAKKNSTADVHLHISRT